MKLDRRDSPSGGLLSCRFIVTDNPSGACGIASHRWNDSVTPKTLEALIKAQSRESSDKITFVQNHLKASRQFPERGRDEYTGEEGVPSCLSCRRSRSIRRRVRLCVVERLGRKTAAPFVVIIIETVSQRNSQACLRKGGDVVAISSATSDCPSIWDGESVQLL
jgi:hypothetical protein